MSLFCPLKYITNVTERVKNTNLVRRRDDIFKWAGKVLAAVGMHNDKHIDHEWMSYTTQRFLERFTDNSFTVDIQQQGQTLFKPCFVTKSIPNQSQTFSE